jgi:uncharacterized membrane protein YhaH (DUF805 family)
MGTTFSFNWYLRVLKHYVQFGGRAKRREYWNFALFNMIFAMILFVLGLKVSSIFTFLYYIYCLAVLIPGLAVCFRRLHDTNRSAWWILISLIPFIGALILIVFLCLGSTEGENQYGAPAPLDPEEGDV